MSKHNVGRVAAVAVLLFLVVGSAAPAQADFPTPAVPGWKLEAVDHQRNFSNLSQQALAYDHQDRPHFVYGGDGLYHAWQNGSSFQVDVVDSSVDVGQHASIAISQGGDIHIAYYDAAHGDLKYVARMAGVWTPPQTVIWDGDVGVETAIFVDADDVPYILYKDETNNRLMFIAGTMSYPMVWETPELVSGDAEYPYNFSAVMRGMGVFVSYGNITGSAIKELRYARRLETGVWENTVIDHGVNPTDSVGHHSAIDLDNVGVPWIVYSGSNGVSPRIRVAHLSGGYWEITTDLASLSVATDYLDMVISPFANVMHVVYRQHDPSNLYYAEFFMMTWVNGIAIETDGQTGITPSIAYNSLHTPGVIYYDANTSSLHYGTMVSNTTWSPIETVDWNRDVGSCPTMKLDSLGRPHVVYYDALFKGLLYKEYESQWGIRWPVPPSPGVELSCQSALALNSLGLPRVAYTTRDMHSLYYAIGGGFPFSGFTAQQVATDPVIWYQNTSLVLDSNGDPHIVYTRDGDLWHAYRVGSGAWLFEAIKDKPTQTQLRAMMTPPSLAIDASNNLYLAFGNDSGLYFIVRTGAGWQTVQQVTSSLPGNGISIALAPPANIPTIVAAYFSQNGSPEWIGVSSRFSILYPWNTEVVNIAVPTIMGDNFTSPSIAADHSGGLTISYFDDDGALPNGLVVARHVGSQWVNLHVDDQQWAGYQNSLALTTNGRARIAYYDGLSRDLRFAWEWDRVFIPRIKK